MFATDTVALGDIRVSDSGYLEAFARTARTGVQQYLGMEMGRPDLGTVNVYRDEADVFSKSSLHSFAKIPVTVDHPPSGVSAANWKQVAVGTTGEEVLRDGERLKIGLKIMDAAAIQAVKAGKRELSVGYKTEIVWGDGVAPDGTPYQAKQTAIVADHIAIVSAGRAGSACRIGDSWSAIGIEDQRSLDQDPSRISPPSMGNPMKTHLIGDNAVEMSDAAIVAVKALQTQLGSLTADNLRLTADASTLAADHKKALETKDGEIAVAKSAVETKDGEIAVLKAALKDAELTPAKLDAAVSARAEVANAAKKIVGDKLVVDGKTDGEIRREAVVVKLGDSAKTMSDDAINGAFAALSVQAGYAPDAIAASVRDAANPNNPTIVTDAATAYSAMLAHDRNAWQKAN